ncbi:hypothetical protein [Streptomyces sp. NBC_00582]|uniref:hypothetical protein n=1 Tax=Streptomyces sp. NBC_00582 TaxID=2975783 RepID=UPI002E8041EA|nr:hypothetical protein [Streptomyces sp. NBC_00582]WUB64461.1 hypothetical protein OG852_30735 [Streptomyces sp. NBC_00582]
MPDTPAPATPVPADRAAVLEEAAAAIEAEQAREEATEWAQQDEPDPETEVQGTAVRASAALLRRMAAGAREAASAAPTHTAAASTPLPSSHKERRDQYAARIYEYWNPGDRWEDAYPDDRIAYGADADIAMAVADAEAGRTVPAPVRTDIYLEVADRLALFTAAPQGKAATAAQLADKVRSWAGQPSSAPEVATQRPSLTEILGEVAAERGRQDEKWGEQNHPDGTGQYPETIDADVAKMACQSAAEGGYLDWLHILREEVAEAFAESAPDRLRKELVQVAAVATAWIEAIDRRQACVGQACAQHPTAPVIAGHCGGCPVYPADLAPVREPRA